MCDRVRRAERPVRPGGIGSESQGRAPGAVEVRGDEVGVSASRVDLLDNLGAAPPGFKETCVDDIDSAGFPNVWRGQLVAAGAVWHGCHTAELADGMDLPVSES